MQVPENGGAAFSRQLLRRAATKPDKQRHLGAWTAAPSWSIIAAARGRQNAARGRHSAALSQAMCKNETL